MRSAALAVAAAPVAVPGGPLPGIPWVEGCAGCGACLLTCPERAIRPVPGGVAVLAARCTGCGDCVEICPVAAVHLDPPGGAR